MKQRIFKNVKEAVSECQRDIFELGMRVHPQTMQDKDVRDNPDYETLELLAYSYYIMDVSDKDEALKEFFPDKFERIKKYCEQEFEDRISRKALNPGNSWKYRPEIWEEFLHDGKFAYTYSERLHDQIDPIIEELKKNPESRQLVMMIRDKDEDLKGMGGKKRVACSISYNFIKRAGKLHMVYYMRSCDIANHYAIDLWLGIRMLEYIAEQTNIPVGYFIHFITSFHMYRNYGESKKIF